MSQCTFTKEAGGGGIDRKRDSIIDKASGFLPLRQSHFNLGNEPTEKQSCSKQMFPDRKNEGLMVIDNAPIAERMQKAHFSITTERRPNMQGASIYNSTISQNAPKEMNVQRENHAQQTTFSSVKLGSGEHAYQSVAKSRFVEHEAARSGKGNSPKRRDNFQLGPPRVADYQTIT